MSLVSEPEQYKDGWCPFARSNGGVCVHLTNCQMAAQYRLASYYTECPKIYRKPVLYLLKHRFAVYLSRCSTDLR